MSMCRKLPDRDRSPTLILDTSSRHRLRAVASSPHRSVDKRPFPDTPSPTTRNPPESLLMLLTRGFALSRSWRIAHCRNAATAACLRVRGDTAGPGDRREAAAQYGGVDLVDAACMVLGELGQ